jgi:hypothetical protein
MDELWRKVWREGIAPLLTRTQLEALREAVATDDPRLIQGCTTTPPPLQCVADWPVEGACAFGLTGVIEHGGFGVERDLKTRRDHAATVAETEEFFAQTCFAVDQRMGEPAACRWFLNFWDETPRDELRDELLPELDLALQSMEVA